MPHIFTYGDISITGSNGEADENGGWAGVVSLLRTLDPGTMGGDQGSAVFLALMPLVTIGGIFLVSALIGILTTGLDKRIAKLRKGRSRLIERGHTIVLGWSDQVFTIISELVKANQSERRSCVVVLADETVRTPPWPASPSGRRCTFTSSASPSAC
ncbi:hypothetical protein AB0K12_27920 [Nonomuraea sp. NPDC049419]|uniref:hypothetical protein n=1 Tax=Nonomuraea sp. NPDC049419 TaxID=3155772 RepID=UPI003425E46C